VIAEYGFFCSRDIQDFSLPGLSLLKEAQHLGLRGIEDVAEEVFLDLTRGFSRLES
jgi:hypothetical protein